MCVCVCGVCADQDTMESGQLSSFSSGPHGPIQAKLIPVNAVNEAVAYRVYERKFPVQAAQYWEIS